MMQVIHDALLFFLIVFLVLGFLMVLVGIFMDYK